MNAVKIIAVLAGIIAFAALTGFDCPKCNWVVQSIVFGVSVLTAIACCFIIIKKEDELWQ